MEPPLSSLSLSPILRKLLSTPVPTPAANNRQKSIRIFFSAAPASQLRGPIRPGPGEPFPALLVALQHHYQPEEQIFETLKVLVECGYFPSEKNVLALYSDMGTYRFYTSVLAPRTTIPNTCETKWQFLFLLPWKLFFWGITRHLKTRLDRRGWRTPPWNALPLLS